MNRAEDQRAWKDQYMLRLPAGMREQIKAIAEANGRSMNQEIIQRLEFTLENDFSSLPLSLKEHTELSLREQGARLEQMSNEMERLQANLEKATRYTGQLVGLVPKDEDDD